MGLVRPREGEVVGRSRRLRAVAVVAAALTGFGGAAAVDALAAPAIPVADDFGPGDGLTRYVVTAATGDATPDFLTDLEQVDGVASAQRLFDGTALVAVDGVPPQQLRTAPGVAAVEFSPSVPVLGTASDPFYASHGWHLENTGANAYGQDPAKADADIDASDGWDATTGTGVIVAVVDTGYDSDHPDLAGALWTNPQESCGSVDLDGNGLAGDCHGWNFTTNSPDIDNGTGGSHGTSVAGVIAARKDNGAGLAGVAPDVTVMPLAVGSGSGIDVNLGAQAIRYAADHGATVVNASWGGAVRGPALTPLRSAVDYAASKGVLVVAAAGNDAGNRDTSILYPASLTEANVITVGASTANDTVSDFSAYGATSVDLFAPGTLVATTWNDGGYRLVSGTSIAAPQVAAAVALYRSTLPDATTADLKNALLSDVDPVAAFAGRSVSGGRLNVSHLAPAAATTVGYRFSSMSGPVGTLTPHVQVTGPAVSGSYAVALGLGMEHGGEVWALADTPITLGGTTLTTDDAGQVTFPLGALETVDGLEFAPTIDLTEGRYALSTQLVRDGAALGGTWAAPLLVGDVPAPSPGGSSGGGTTPGTGTDPTPGTDTGSGSTPGTGTGSGSTPGTGAGPTPGTGSGSGSTPGAGGGNAGESGGGSGSGDAPDAPGAVGPGTGNPGDGTPGGIDPGTDTGSGSTPAPGTGTTPGTDPGSGTGSGSTPGSGAGSSPGTGDPGTPSEPDVVNYPEVGPFGLTSISPATVGTAGGTRVTVTGTNIPDGVRVLIGDSRAASVISSTSTSVVFTAPAAVAGAYDVHVFNAAGTASSVLEKGLTYTDAPSDGTSPDTGTGTGATPGTGTGTGGSDDGTDDGSTTDPGSGGTGGATSPVTTKGPHGQRLVRSKLFGSLGSSFWSVDCSTSCRGVLL